MKQLLILVLACAFLGCKSPEARPPVSENSGSFISASVKRNKALNKKEQEKIQTVIAKYPNKNFIASENGFWYHYNTKIEDNTATPEFGDRIEYTYDVSDLNGNAIYTQQDLGPQRYIMEKEELFTGLREGLKLMKAGESVTFIFPSPQAFGYYGDDNKIGTNVPLICNVTLNTITQNND